MARRRSTGKTIDFKSWSAIPGIVIDPIGADTTSIGGALSFSGPATILRCRGSVKAMFDETKQVGDNASFTFGLGIVSTDAFNAGAGSVPDPEAEPEYPWLWWGHLDLQSFVAAGEEAWGTTNQQLEVDTKAMRRMKPGESLIWVVETTSFSGAPVSIVEIGITRVLIGT